MFEEMESEYRVYIDYLNIRVPKSFFTWKNFKLFDEFDHLVGDADIHKHTFFDFDSFDEAYSHIATKLNQKKYVVSDKDQTKVVVCDVPKFEWHKLGAENLIYCTPCAALVELSDLARVCYRFSICDFLSYAYADWGDGDFRVNPFTIVPADFDKVLR